MTFAAFIFKNLTQRPIRTALTVLGLSVAVGSMVALMGIAKSFRAAQAATFEERGVDLVTLRGGDAIQLTSEVPEWVVREVQKWPEVKAIDAALVDMTEMQIREPRNADDVPPSKPVILQAWLPVNFGFDDMEVLAGRKLDARDEGKCYAMLGNDFAKSVNKKVGDTVTILQKKFEVVGVFKTSNFLEKGGVLTLLKDYQDLSGRKGVVTGFSVRVNKTTKDPDAEVEAVRQRIAALKSEKGDSLRLTPERPDKYLDNASHLKITAAMAWMVSAIAMLIGVISMLNTMAMSVLERTQEIGILRAIGWPRRRVIQMVIGEALLLALVAAVLGGLGALGATHLMALFPQVNTLIEPGIAGSVIVTGTGFALLIGLLGGAYPAYRASRLLPTEALRHD
jgi:putative ABC transport system permease protein